VGVLVKFDWKHNSFSTNDRKEMGEILHVFWIGESVMD
jgi:hypothetical protein